MTNQERCAAKIDPTVREYEHGPGLECGVVDILTDLRHYCDKHGLDFAEACDDSYSHYIEEAADDRRTEVMEGVKP